jgi:hypothetical protein
MQVPMDSGSLEKRLAGWGKSGAAEDFPYQSVMAFYRASGKHFVPGSVLEALASVRANLVVPADPGSEAAALRRFLDVALDKWDQAYNYQTYIGLSLLELIPDADGRTAGQQHDEWMSMLLADARAFECGARDDRHDSLPLMRPGPELGEKRIRLLERAMSLIGGAARAAATGDNGRNAARRRERALALSMQPVYIVHDEYLFIRILQAFEVTFAAMAGLIRDAISASRRGDARAAAASILSCSRRLSGARRLFTVLATMRAEAFRAFRAYTVGASAIQSGNYKVFEALCCAPPGARLESPAFEAVPLVRERVLGPWTDLQSTVERSVASGLIDPPGLGQLRASAAELESAHQRWKLTHWKMADRMIADERGTGYTAGVPYLKSALDNRLFWRALSPSEADCPPLT